MIHRNELTKLAKARLKDADILAKGKRYDGAIYLCGYAVELSLKARICKTLRWPQFPATRAEFQPYQSFKSHNLDVLLHLTGIEDKIKSRLLAEWSTVAEWDPEVRYKPIGSANISDATQMLSATATLLRNL